MKTMRYTSSQVCRFLGITKETLRHYESKGLIAPQIDGNNRYRYYTDWDIMTLVECRKYRSMEYSVGQVAKLMENDDLKVLEENVKEMADFYRAREEFYAHIREKETVTLREIQSYREDPHMVTDGPMDETVIYLAYTDIEQFQEDRFKYVNLQNMNMQDYAFSDFSLIIERKNAPSQIEYFIGGTSFRGKWAKQAAIPESKVRRYRFDRALSVLWEVNSRLLIPAGLFAFMKTEEEKRGLRLEGDVIGTLLCSTRLKRLFRFWFPVAERRG